MPLGANANLPLLPGFLGFAAANQIVGTPLKREYTVISTSYAIRPGDPVVLLTSGKIRRANITDAAILGFAAEPSTLTGYMGGQFPFEPLFRTDRLNTNNTQSDVRITVYVADGQTMFTGKTKGSAALTNRGGTWDFAYACVGIQPTVTAQGTTGSTTYTYKVVPRSLVGQSAASSSGGAATDGNATLSSVNFIRITWSAQVNAVEYEIWKLNGSTYELLDTVPAGTLTYDDTGAVTANSSVSIPSSTAASNNSGFMLDVATSAVDIAQLVDFVFKSPLDSVSTAGVLANFQIPASKCQFLGAAAASS